MSRLRLLIVALGLAAIYPPQDARLRGASFPGAEHMTAQATPTPTLGAVIRGAVVAADTGMPVTDAAVSLIPLDRAPRESYGGPWGEVRGVLESSGSKAVTVVRADGRFELRDVKPGYYRVRAVPGTTSAQYLTGQFPDPHVHDPPVLVIGGPRVVSGVEIRLPRAAVITGRVVDERGAPIAAVRVSARPARSITRSPVGREFAVLPTLTDDAGAFRVFGLGPDDYVVYAEPMIAGHLTLLAQGAGQATRYGRRFAPAYYPGTASAASAVRVRVGAGETYGPVEFPLTEVRLLTISGTVVDPAGHPVPNTHVQARRGGAPYGDTGPGGLSTADGAFHIAGLIPDDYLLSATRMSEGEREVGWTTVPIVDDVTGLVVRLQQGATVRGQVYVEGAAPASLAGLRVRALPAGPVTVDPVEVQPAADGSFLLSRHHGPTFVRADGLPGWHLLGVRYGGQDITDRPVEFGTRGPDLQVTLTARPATLAGTVRTTRGSPVDGTVLLVSDDPAAFHEQSTTTRLTPAGGDGAYRIEGLRAGRYLAVAVHDDQPLAGLTREYFDLVTRHATPVVIHDGQSATLNLTLSLLRH